MMNLNDKLSEDLNVLYHASWDAQKQDVLIRVLEALSDTMGGENHRHVVRRWLQDHE